MLNINNRCKVYLACGSTDLRKSIDGLSIIVQECFKLDPFSSNLFVFCNKDRNKIKVLHWERNGFWLYYRRLECGRFKWPTNQEQISEISIREFKWLLEGLSLIQHQTPHPELKGKIAY